MTSRFFPLRALRFRRVVARPIASAALASNLLVALGCADVTRFSSVGDHFEGSVVAGSFVLAGFQPKTSVCLVLDAGHLQHTPGTISSNDGRFVRTPLRPIPEIWEDPLSTLAFGEGRVQNLVYMVTPFIPDGLGDVTVVLSLMQSGSVEVRLFRGAPPVGSEADAGTADAGTSPLFGVFALTRTPGQCSF
jgi:hypothetical protein